VTCTEENIQQILSSVHIIPAEASLLIYILARERILATKPLFRKVMSCGKIWLNRKGKKIYGFVEPYILH
jgi:hypothetical protein